MIFSWAASRESLKSLKTQESITVPTRTNPLGCSEEHGFLGGSKSLEHRCKAFSVLRQSARAERNGEILFGSPKGRKALKGGAHERWGLKDASKVGMAK